MVNPSPSASTDAHPSAPLWSIDVGLLLTRLLFAGTMFWFHGLGKLGALLAGKNPWAGLPNGFIGLGGGVEFALAALSEATACQTQRRPEGVG